MASNFTNFSDRKPIVINSGGQSGIVQMNPSMQNGPQQMTASPGVSWAQSTQQWQVNNSQSAHNNGYNQGYTVQQIRPAMPTNMNPRMAAASGSPSRTIPPSWPSSSPKQASTITIQRPSAPTSNPTLVAGEQRPPIKSEVNVQPQSQQTIRVIQPNQQIIRVAQPNTQPQIRVQNFNNQAIRPGIRVIRPGQAIRLQNVNTSCNRPGMSPIRIQQVQRPKLEGVKPQPINMQAVSMNNITNRLPCPSMNNVAGTPTKMEVAPTVGIQNGQQQMIRIASPAKLGMDTQPKMNLTTPKKQGLNKTLIKPGGIKAMGKSPMKVPGKPGWVKPSGSVTSSSNAVYKEWKSKFGSHDENGFHCNMCPDRKSFTADSSLRRHYTQAHEQICKTCKMEFSEEHLLQQHYREKHEFKCMLCSKVFTAFSSVRRHHEKEHPGQEIPKGGTPIKSEPASSLENNADSPMMAFDGTQIKSEIQNNFSAPNGQTPIQSPQKSINLTMTNKSPLKKMAASPLKKIAGTSMKKLGACPGKSPGKALTPTDNAFSNRVYRIWKEKFATEDGKGCKICPGKVFTAESSLKRHYKQTHELVCAQCKMEFPEEHLLREHHREQHEFWCFPCNKVFTAYSSLKRHNVQAHDGVPQGKPSGNIATERGVRMELPDPASLGIGNEMSPMKPTIVQNGTVSPAIKKVIRKPFGTPLKSPMKKLSIAGMTKSPGKSPMKGKEPGKDTPFSSKVFKEWRSKYAKKDETGFHCLVCPKSFTLDSSLKRHYKNMHELVCKCCSMQFSEEDLLKAHHKEKHEYWCTPCNRVFTLKSSLIRHNVQQHGAVSPRKQPKQENIKADDGTIPITPGTISAPIVDPNIVIPPVDIDYQGLRHEDIAEDPAEDSPPLNVDDIKDEADITELLNRESESYPNDYESSNMENENISNIDNFAEEMDTSFFAQNVIQMKQEHSEADETPQITPGGTPQKTPQKRGEGEFPCPECDKMFSNKGNMNRHYNSTHVFPCKVCKQKFVEKQLMETHYFEEHVMHCLVCKKPFSNKGNLNRHMKQAHGEELPKDYQAPTQGKQPKHGTPRKNPNQMASSKLSSPQMKQIQNRLPSAMTNMQRLPLPQFRPDLNPPKPPHPTNILSQTNNIRLAQPNHIRLAQPNIVLQQQNYTSQNQQIYHQVMTPNSQSATWEVSTEVDGNGWMTQ